MKPIKMVEVTRGKNLESVHFGTAVLIKSSGEILKEWGDSNTPICPRNNGHSSKGGDAHPHMRFASRFPLPQPGNSDIELGSG